ncbi:GNAT family N-acetyltransferase [Spirosoma daeguense]
MNSPHLIPYMQINQVNEADFPDWLRLALALWPDDTEEEMTETLRDIQQSPKQAGFIARDNQGKAIGFMNLSLRIDYVPGALQSPVAYLEGIYVVPEFQQQGVGQALVRQAEQWASLQGCTELASDVLLENALGQSFHKRAGFDEVERVVYFIKSI